MRQELEDIVAEMCTYTKSMFVACATLRKLAFSFSSLHWKMLLLQNSRGAELDLQPGRLFPLAFFFPVEVVFERSGLLLAFLHFGELFNSLVMIPDSLDKASSLELCSSDEFWGRIQRE